MERSGKCVCVNSKYSNLVTYLQSEEENVFVRKRKREKTTTENGQNAGKNGPSRSSVTGYPDERASRQVWAETDDPETRLQTKYKIKIKSNR